ncbi:MAG: carboxypeptidase-like regulatory domain-containing protein [Candidatus Latescibacter sp.]|nr:carboxypeptidase-like regulatory domain-containing protein [Candidatus Latescibacter sp.]
MNLSRITYPVLLLVLSFLVMAGCSKSSKNPLSPDTNQKEFTTGNPAVYTVSGPAGTALKDSITGATFQFPEGASGTLSIASVTSGPSLSIQAKKFSVDYTGSESIQLAVPHKTGEQVVLFSYGSIGKAAIDGCGLIGWWGIPAIADSSGYVVFNVLSPVKLSALKIAGLSQTQQKEYYAISTISGGTDVAANIEAIRTTTKQVVDQWLDNLPSSLYTSARNRVNGSLQYTFAFKDDGNAYTGNNSMIWSNAVFEFNPYPGEKKADLATIAHEVGHYMTHVLTGYPRFAEILNRITDWNAYANHGLAEYSEGRKVLLEEYAYFSTYMITGELNGTDLKRVNFRTFFQSRAPDSYDYPSQEGYGAALLGALMKTEGEIISFDKTTPKVKAPLVGASVSDILGILARGPRDVNELRSFIQDYLDGRGGDDRFKLPALFEPMGWSYNGTGVVVDSQNKPVAGAHLQCISQSAGTEYRTFMSTRTGADGKFYLPRIFPGENIIRLFYNADKDSVDFPLSVEWTKPTNVQIDLKEYVIEAKKKTVDLKLPKANYVLTPGIRAQNPLTVSATGTLTGPDGMIAVPTIITDYSGGNAKIDIQSSVNLNEEVTLTLTATYSLFRGETWTTGLYQGDYKSASESVTKLSGVRFKISSQRGGETLVSSTQSTPNLNIRIAPADKSGYYYRADVRLEWDYNVTYYNAKGDVEGTETGTTGAYILHIYQGTM